MIVPIPRPWTLGQRIAFRFFFAFFVLYCSSFILGIVPFLSGMDHQFWYSVVPWVGTHILHLPPITIFPNGSGDTTYNYVHLLCLVVLSLFIAMVWSVLDRKRDHYEALHYCLRVMLRYYIATMMLSYGFAKIFHLQMGYPNLAQLVQPFGDKSPMGLAWSYVGFSKGFSAFAGWSEVIGGVFLFFRRTATLGVLICIVVMANVVAMNFFFDVPVKLFSSVLLVMLCFLLAPDAERLLNVLLLNKSAEPRLFRNFLHRKWMRITAVVIKVLFIGSTLYGQVYNGLKGRHQYGDLRPRPPLYGIYNAKLLIRNHDTVPMLLTDTSHWKQLIIQTPQRAQIKLMNDSLQYWAFKVDTIGHTATVFRYTDTLNKYVLSYKTDSSTLVLEGRLQNDSVHFQFSKQDIRSFRLMSRGFRWVNEYPYNR